jgi:hypothetical protein
MPGVWPIRADSAEMPAVSEFSWRVCEGEWEENKKNDDIFRLDLQSAKAILLDIETTKMRSWFGGAICCGRRSAGPFM